MQKRSCRACELASKRRRRKRGSSRQEEIRAIYEDPVKPRRVKFAVVCCQGRDQVNACREHSPGTLSTKSRRVRSK